MTRKYRIDIDCADCAAKLEESLNRVEGVERININFIKNTLTVTANDKDFECVFQSVLNEAKRIEPDCVIAEEMAEKEKERFSLELVKIILSAVLFILSFFLPQVPKAVLAAAAYIIAGYDVVWKAVKNICHGKVFDENFLMTVASLGSLAMGNFSEAAAVMVLYQIGEYFQDMAVERSRSSISSLMDIRPDYANVVENGETRTVSPENVEIGTMVLVKPGEKIPLDGVIVEGTTSLNTVALTGESVPRDAVPGDKVLSGCINMTGVITLRTESTFGESTVAKILELVENSGDNKAQSEKFITRFSKVYTPCVCAAALLLAVIPSLITGGCGEWVRRALTFLVISCPCALVISVPLSFFCGIGGASSKGILIKGANHMETLAKLGTILFDKTGTLTKGVFQVTEVKPTGCTREYILEKAAYCENYSSHPISKSLRAAYGKPTDRWKVDDVEEISGKGVSANVGSTRVCCGNSKMMELQGIVCPETDSAGTVVHVAENGKYLGYIVISDVVKDNAASAMEQLKRQGVTRLIMLSGDRQEAARSVSDTLGLTEYHAELLPGEKVQQVERILSENHDGKVAFVGDGINDAPVLRRTDVGIAMGAMGSDAAIEAADVVLMDDNIAKLPLAIRIAKKSMAIVKENIVFALAVKLIVLLLGACGVVNMWLAVAADVGVCMAAIINAMRAMRIK